MLFFLRLVGVSVIVSVWPLAWIMTWWFLPPVPSYSIDVPAKKEFLAYRDSDNAVAFGQWIRVGNRFLVAEPIEICNVQTGEVLVTLRCPRTPGRDVRIHSWDRDEMIWEANGNVYVHDCTKQKTTEVITLALDPFFAPRRTRADREQVLREIFERTLGPDGMRVAKLSGYGVARQALEEEDWEGLDLILRDPKTREPIQRFASARPDAGTFPETTWSDQRSWLRVGTFQIFESSTGKSVLKVSPNAGESSLEFGPNENDLFQVIQVAGNLEIHRYRLDDGSTDANRRWFIGPGNFLKLQPINRQTLGIVWNRKDPTSSTMVAQLLEWVRKCFAPRRANPARWTVDPWLTLFDMTSGRIVLEIPVETPLSLEEGQIRGDHLILFEGDSNHGERGEEIPPPTIHVWKVPPTPRLTLPFALILAVLPTLLWLVWQRPKRV